MLRAARQVLRSPRVILGEIAVIALASVLGATLPQVGAASSAVLGRLHESGPVVAALGNTFALDHIFRSWWFLCATLLASASLSIVVLEQAKRFCAQSSRRLAVSHFQNAPLRAEFERPARSGPGSQPTTTCWTQGRLGQTGPGVFHLGLLIVMLAGALRALFGSEAVVDLIEGETLAPTTTAWGAQSPGVLGRPVKLDLPVTVEAVNSARYQDGSLRALNARLLIHSKTGSEQRMIGVNHDLSVGGERVFLSSDFGPAALLEWQSGNAEPSRQAVLLKHARHEYYEGTAFGPGGHRAHLRMRMDTGGQTPEPVEVRLMKDSALLLASEATVGETVNVPGGVELTLHGTPKWVRLRESHDSAIWLAYTGFALMMIGAITIFIVVKVDGCMVVSPLGERERVFIALKPQRFAPLFQERFERLVRENGGPAIARHGPQTAPPFPGKAAVSESRPLGAEPESDLRVAARALAGLWLLTGVTLLTGTGCGPAPRDQARQLVERYNRVVSEAYRRGDVKLIDPVAGPNEGRKLTGLIGVRLDLGLTLDSQLLSLEITGVEKSKDELKVRTKEQWRYRDLKIGTGEQVGEDSLDQYEMFYLFRRIDKQWLVDEIQFASPPQVGRKTTTWAADIRMLHGIAHPAEKMEAKAP